VWGECKVALDKIARRRRDPYLTTHAVTGRFFMEECCGNIGVTLPRIQSVSRDHLMGAEAF